jgi:hypothetical protein
MKGSRASLSLEFENTLLTALGRLRETVSRDTWSPLGAFRVHVDESASNLTGRPTLFPAASIDPRPPLPAIGGVGTIVVASTKAAIVYTEMVFKRAGRDVRVFTHDASAVSALAVMREVALLLAYDVVVVFDGAWLKAHLLFTPGIRTIDYKQLTAEEKEWLVAVGIAEAVRFFSFLAALGEKNQPVSAIAEAVAGASRLMYYGDASGGGIGVVTPSKLNLHGGPLSGKSTALKVLKILEQYGGKRDAGAGVIDVDDALYEVMVKDLKTEPTEEDWVAAFKSPLAAREAVRSRGWERVRQEEIYLTHTRDENPPDDTFPIRISVSDETLEQRYSDLKAEEKSSARISGVAEWLAKGWYTAQQGEFTLPSLHVAPFLLFWRELMERKPCCVPVVYLAAEPVEPDAKGVRLIAASVCSISDMFSVDVAVDGAWARLGAQSERKEEKKAETYSKLRALHLRQWNTVRPNRLTHAAGEELDELASDE